MAITKIHPIKVNLKAALDYIENPDKTDDKMLVSSFGCSYETADIEFQMLLDQAFKKGNNLAHHLIQAFEPGETTPEQAHEIGRQLVDEVLQGKYPYVLTTHIDKGHLHNHIIFCAVDMVQQRKYVSNRRSYAYIRRTSDRLCRENGLSVVKPGKDKGKSYAEWDAQRKGKSWKAKLKITIDAAIPQAKDFDDFLRLMQAQGYEIKQGKFTSFRAPGQERLPRTETPPEDYTQVSFVCLRPDGAYEAPATVSSVCRYSRKKIGDMDDFHFHLLRHTYTTNLLSHGAAPKDVQELLGHSDVSTTMNIYAHATREAKRTSARLLDKVVGTA